MQRILMGCALAAGIGAHAAEPGAHVHGQATLQVVADGANLQLRMETPLDNVLGFEHAPRDEKQRAAVRAMAARLRQPLALFQPTAAARCEVASVQLASSALAPELIGEKAAAPAASKEPDGHADLDVDIALRCAAPGKLQGLDAAGLIRAFPGLHRLRVEAVGPRGQSAADLQPGRTSVRW